MPGQPTVYERWNAGTSAYNVDWNNVAPSVGFNWSPERRGGRLGTLMGNSGDFVIRGGFAAGFQQPGMTEYRGRFSANPGLSIPVQRNYEPEQPRPLPLLLRDRGHHGAGLQSEPVFPNSGTITNSVNAFDPNIQVPYSDSWTQASSAG
jgi:hypothetical protein